MVDLVDYNIVGSRGVNETACMLLIQNFESHKRVKIVSKPGINTNGLPESQSECTIRRSCKQSKTVSLNGASCVFGSRRQRWVPHNPHIMGRNFDDDEDSK